MSEQYTEKKDLNAYQRINRMTKTQHRLFSVHWELTYRCNEKCTHCYLDVMAPGAKVPGELTTQEAKDAIDELAKLGGLTITFSGGEIFLRPDIFEIAHYARKRGFAVRFFTNGMMVKGAVADKIAAVRPVVVEISLYGTTAEVHDEITQVPGSFDLTMRAIHTLLDRKVRVMIKSPLMKENIHQFDDLQALARDLGITFSFDMTIIPKHTGDTTPLKHRVTDQQLLDFLRPRTTPETWNLPEQDEEFRFCGIGMNSLSISPYGEIYTCLGARVSAGNIRSMNLQDIWTESPVWEETTNLTLHNLPVCATCELSQFCIRCHGTAAFEDGDMLGCSSSAYREARIRRQAYMENATKDGIIPLTVAQN
ncbi:MAG TPA: radical SAM protein [Anaerolineae bacterium]|nr:radical SAM protein [Anaerolineae bacterium]